MLAQQESRLVEACGEEPSRICEWVFDRTDSVGWAELADIVFARPLEIFLVVLVAWIVNRLARRGISRLTATMAGEQPPQRRLRRRLRATLGDRMAPGMFDTGQVSLRAAARAETIGLVLRSVASVLIWTIAGITVLGQIGIAIGPLLASAGIAGVALGFGSQSLVRDFLSGTFMLIEDQYGVGDFVDAGEAIGMVEAVTLRTTKLRDINGTVWHIPNGEIHRIGNMSQQWARALLDISVAYSTDLDQAQAVIKDVADELTADPDYGRLILEAPEVWGVQTLGADGIDVRLVIKTRPSEQWKVARELRRRLKARFDAEGIEIPFPQRTMWVRRDEGHSLEKAVGDGSAADADEHGESESPARTRRPAKRATKSRPRKST